jgi:hypothetical protein
MWVCQLHTLIINEVQWTQADRQKIENYENYQALLAELEDELKAITLKRKEGKASPVAGREGP